MKKNKVFNYIKNIPVFISIAVLIVFAVLFLELPLREFSENENRVLAICPEPSLESILDGSFRDSFETFVSDQFPMRDELLVFSVLASRTLGKQKINDVIYAKEDNGQTRLIDDYKEPINEEKFIEAVGRLYDGAVSANITVMIVPTAYQIYEDEMPSILLSQERAGQQDTYEYLKEGIIALDDSEKPSGINIVEEITDSLEEGKNAGYNIYYRTDHHWTMYGAYRGYLALAPYLNIPVNPVLEDQMTTVSESFYGTTWSRVVDYSVDPDTIEIYENPDWADSLVVSYEDTKETYASPYNMEYLDKKDKYSLFLNNQHSLIRIDNPDADLTRTDGNKRSSIVVIKDSYANSLIPLLIDQYETIWVFDPRYYRGSITAFVNEHPEVQDVLILYNLTTMDNDRGIGAIN